MRVGIHHDRGRRLTGFSQKYVEIARHNGIDAVVLDVDDPGFWDLVRGLDAFVYRWTQYPSEKERARALLPVLEREMGLRVFPNQATCWHFDDKVRQYYVLLAQGFPVVESWVFWSREAAESWVEEAQFPVVFKLRSGASSATVKLVRGRAEALRLIRVSFTRGLEGYWLPVGLMEGAAKGAYRRFRKKLGRLRMRLMEPVLYWETVPEVQRHHVMFQRYLPNNDFDTRVNIIGDRAFAFRRFNRPGDFRASGSGKLDWDPRRIDLEMVRIAFEVSRRMGFQCMGYDFLYGVSGAPEICEMSYTFKDWGVYNCPGYWDSEMRWHEGHFWPQHCQLKDLLNLPDLECLAFER